MRRVMADGRYGHFGKANMLSEGVAASERLARARRREETDWPRQRLVFTGRQR